MCFAGINFFARKTPKNHSYVVDLNKVLVIKEEFDGI